MEASMTEGLLLGDTTDENGNYKIWNVLTIETPEITSGCKKDQTHISTGASDPVKEELLRSSRKQWQILQYNLKESSVGDEG